MTNTETAAQVDLDKLEALARAVPEHLQLKGWYVAAPSFGHQHVYADNFKGQGRQHIASLPAHKTYFAGLADFIAAANPATILALIAQARAQPAAAPIALSVNSGEGAPSDLPRWIDNQKGSDPMTDDLIAYIEDLRAQLARTHQSGRTAAIEDYKPVVADLRARLAAALAAPHAQAEPVARIEGWKLGLQVFRSHYEAVAAIRNPELKPIPLYAAPVPQEAEQAANPGDLDALVREYGNAPVVGPGRTRATIMREIYELAGEIFGGMRQEAEQASVSPAGVEDSRDAVRYRWLRNHSNMQFDPSENVQLVVLKRRPTALPKRYSDAEDAPFRIEIRQALDEAVDTAMSAAPTTTKG